MVNEVPLMELRGHFAWALKHSSTKPAYTVSVSVRDS